MISQPKWVKKANLYVVTERDDNPNNKKCKQTQSWFSSLEEAQAFVKSYIPPEIKPVR